MSVSAVQLVANQNNAKKSTGPVTVQGKQTVSNNALKHGVFSNGVKDVWFVLNRNENQHTLLDYLGL